MSDKLSQIAEICIRIRNEMVRKALIGRHSNMMKQTLPVFCVSNLEYLKHVVGAKDHPPTMTVEATEIPRIRDYISSLPADRKCMAFRHHLKFVLPSLINNIGMTCSQSKLRRREELHQVLLGVKKGIPDQIGEIFNELLKDSILDRLSDIRTNKSIYIAEAKKKLQIYSEWPSMTQKAFCYHKGKWETKKVGSHDWNVEMLGPLVKDMREGLRPWGDIGEALGRSLSDKLLGTLHSLLAQLEDAAGPSKSVLQSFFDEMRLQVDSIDELCRLEAQVLEKGLCHIRDCILLVADPESCYFVQALGKTYTSCTTVKGPRVSHKRIKLIEVKLSSKGMANPIYKVHDFAKIAAQKLIKQHTEGFSKKISEIFQKLHDTFLRLYTTGESNTPEAKALRDKLRSRLPDYKAKLAECKRLLQEIFPDSPGHRT